MTTFQGALAEALIECTHWMNGAAVIRMADGSYAATSSMNVRYYEDADVVASMTHPGDMLGPEVESLEGFPEDAAHYAAVLVREFGEPRVIGTDDDGFEVWVWAA